MFKVGITGGIGSGKTTVCQIFEVLGVPVFYADTEAKKIMTTDAELIDGIKTAFGTASYLEDGRLDNKYIASIVFNKETELARLNALVHPAVFRAFDRWENEMNVDVPYTLKEAALLFESGSYKMCDTTILVTAPLELKLHRVMKRDQVSRVQVEARMDKQWSDEQKMKMANRVIVNDEQHALIAQVMELHQVFLAQGKSV